MHDKLVGCDLYISFVASFCVYFYWVLVLALYNIEFLLYMFCVSLSHEVFLLKCTEFKLFVCV